MLIIINDDDDGGGGNEKARVRTYASVRLQVVDDDFRPTVAAVSAVQHVQVPSDPVQVDSDRRLDESTVVEFL